MTDTQAFARELGAEWAGDSLGPAPEPLDAALIFAPVGALVPAALRATDRAGVGRLRRDPHERHPVVPLRGALGGARAALGRQPDPSATARSSSPLAPRVPVRTEVSEYPLERANDALEDLRAGRFRGAAVVVPPRPAA